MTLDLHQPREAVAFLRSLRAIRLYAPTPIPDQAWQDILDVARWTGSAKNRQPWELIVLQDRDVLSHFRESGPGWQARINATLRRSMTGSKR